MTCSPVAIHNPILFSVFCLLLQGCVPKLAGPRIRVATATAEQLAMAEEQDNVWYEFQPGDVVPVDFGFIGAVEGGTTGEAVMRAKQLFYYVVRKNRPIQLSFDGKTLASDKSNQAIIAVMPSRKGKGGRLVWIVYMGKEGDPKAELERVAGEASQARQASRVK